MAAAGPAISSTASWESLAGTVTPDTPNAKFRSAPAIDADVSFDTVHVTDVTPPAHTASPANTNPGRRRHRRGRHSSSFAVAGPVVVVPTATHAATFTDP